MKDHIKANIINAKRITENKNPAKYQQLRNERYVPIIDMILKYAERDMSVLDVGIREGAMLEVMKDHGFQNLHGIDIYAPGVSRASRLGFNTMIADIQEFVPKDKFDVVIMSHVLEHLPEPAKVIKNIKDNIIKDNGILYVEVPKEGKGKNPSRHAHYFFFSSLNELMSFFKGWQILESTDGIFLKILARVLK